MLEHESDFKFFIEDDKSFDDYMKEMQRDAIWGGNLEIQALAMRFSVNFYIHIYNHPMYIVHNFENPLKNIHMSYHDGEHYNSVRLKIDTQDDDMPMDIPLELINMVEQSTNMIIGEDDNEGEGSTAINTEADGGDIEKDEDDPEEEGNNPEVLPPKDELSFFGNNIKDMKLKNNDEETKRCIITEEGIIMDIPKDFSKCHCGNGNKKYKNCCSKGDFIGDYSKKDKIFYCDIDIFKRKFHCEVVDKKGTANTHNTNNTEVNNITKKMEKIFI
jgi:hypothetical protein